MLFSVWSFSGSLIFFSIAAADASHSNFLEQTLSPSFFFSPETSNSSGLLMQSKIDSKGILKQLPFFWMNRIAD